MTIADTEVATEVAIGNNKCNAPIRVVAVVVALVLVVDPAVIAAVLVEARLAVAPAVVKTADVVEMVVLRAIKISTATTGKAERETFSVVQFVTISLHPLLFPLPKMQLQLHPIVVKLEANGMTEVVTTMKI